MGFLKTFLIPLFLLAWAGTAMSADVMAILSVKVKPYGEALEGFKSACGCSIVEIDISNSNLQDLKKNIRDKRPPLLFAVGLEALDLLESFNDIPIVYSMALNSQALSKGKKNITGVGWEIHPDKLFETLRHISPDINRIGIAFDPRNTSQLLEMTWLSAKPLGLKLIARRVYESKGVPDLIKGMLGLIDSYWMIPDLAVNSPENVRFLMDFSIANNIPVFTFSEKFVEMGALMALKPEIIDMGRQAGEMASRILAGAKPEAMAPANPRKIDLIVNLETARKMGITFNSNILQQARVMK